MGHPITYHDIQDQDYEYYKNLKWIVENNIEGVLDLTWRYIYPNLILLINSYEYNNFNKVEVIDLIENGRNKMV